MTMIKWVFNSNRGSEKTPVEFFSAGEIKKVRDFHRSFAGYAETPLRSLNNLAKYLGVSGIFVKDESYRFGLNAFKALGATFAVGSYLAGRLKADIKELSYEKLKSKAVREQLGEITFTTATDGNHGRGVAWAAQQLGHKAVIYMPKGSAPARLNNIKATGAEAYITDFNYDDTVRLAAEEAKKHRRVSIQDTVWEGYADIPVWIMQGYCTMADEAFGQLKQQGVERPTHVFLQAGVGSFPGAMQGYFAAALGDDCPATVIVEPDKADCIYQSALAKDGRPRNVSGDMDTIMAGLACGEPNPLAWNILRDYSAGFIACSDDAAANGMRILGNPLRGDDRVISGESGAVTTGVVRSIMQDNTLREVRKRLKLDAKSNILLFNTEGDTDPDNYRRIVWDGAYPNTETGQPV